MGSEYAAASRHYGAAVKIDLTGLNVEVDQGLRPDSWFIITKRDDGSMTIAGADITGKVATLRISQEIARRLLEQIGPVPIR